MNNVSMAGDVDMDSIVRIDADEDEIRRYEIVETDLLFNTRNSKELVGKVGLVRSVNGATVYNNNLMRVRFDGAVAPEFACYQLCGPEFRGRMEKVKKATTSVAAVYAKDLFPLAIAVPPMEEQVEIVRCLDCFISGINQQDAAIDFSLKQAAAQRKNLLKAAFAGQLVPQDSSDEPASELLARIRTERASNDTSTPRRRRKTA
jgi:type I restriction enzyme S subunit